MLLTALVCCCFLLPHVVGLIFWNWQTTNPHVLEQATVVHDLSTRRQINQQTSCSNDSHCSRSSFCDRHYGLCKPHRLLGDPCRSKDQCAHHLDCSFGRCMTPIEPKGPGARCRGDEDCDVGLCCARRHGVRVCKRKLAPLQQCFIPDGGLSYFLNELCPCEEGYICRAESQLHQQFPLSTSFACRMP